MLPTMLRMHNGSGDFLKELRAWRQPLAIVFPVNLQPFNYWVTGRKGRGGKLLVQQQPEFKARVRRRELDACGFLQPHRFKRQPSAFVVRSLKIKNDPDLIVGDAEPLFRQLFSLVSNLDGRARESQRVRSFRMQDFHLSRRQIQPLSERVEVIWLRFLALRDNEKSFAGRRKARLSAPVGGRPPGK